MSLSIGIQSPNWGAFMIKPDGHAPRSRPIHTTQGIGDRLRSAAFAEIQAKLAFEWAASTFQDAPSSLKTAWLGLAHAEDKHLGWLIERLEEIGEKVEEREVSDFLWKSFMKCDSAESFALYMAKAEERGRIAGERFRQALHQIDSKSSELFGQIAKEENEHIELALRYFPHHRKEIDLIRSQANC